jgi:hypothetical protein
MRVRGMVVRGIEVIPLTTIVLTSRPDREGLPSSGFAESDMPAAESFSLPVFIRPFSLFASVIARVSNAPARGCQFGRRARNAGLRPAAASQSESVRRAGETLVPTVLRLTEPRSVRCRRSPSYCATPLVGEIGVRVRSMNSAGFDRFGGGLPPVKSKPPVTAPNGANGPAVPFAMAVF